MPFLDIVSVVLSSIPTLSLLIVGTVRWSRHRRERSLLKLSPRGRVDVVVATVVAHERRQGKLLARPATGLGQVVGVSHIAAVLARLHRHKAVNILLSSRMMGLELDEDVILLGAPISNDVSGRFLEALAKRGFSIEFDSDSLSARIPGHEVHDFDLERARSKLGVPRRDLGLIIVTRNPWEPRQRAIMCCGFSTYGTGAAATYLFTKLSRKEKGFWDALRISPRKADGFGMLLDVCFDEEGHPFEYEPRAAFAIEGQDWHPTVEPLRNVAASQP